MVKIVCAPDSFKGSVTAAQAAAAMARGALEALPEAEVLELPFADGGEGTLDALLAVWGQEPRSAETVDALRRPCTARYGLSPDGGTAVIEAAEANGLPQVSDQPLRPQTADTYGVGLLAARALEAGAREILLCIGGSATTDGGTGILTALGVRLLDAEGEPVPPGGAGLSRVNRVDTSGLHPRARDVRWRIASDVENPLTGSEGAAAVFGPQKGADEQDVEALDAGLHHLAEVLSDVSGISAEQLRSTPGYGAAGGIPVALVSMFGAEVLPGSAMVAEAVGLEEALRGADLVLTGEGRLDSQSLRGKVVDAVASRAPQGAVVVALAGAVQLTPAECRGAGLAGAFSIAPGAAQLEDLQDRAAELLEQAASHVISLVAASLRSALIR